VPHVGVVWSLEVRVGREPGGWGRGRLGRGLGGVVCNRRSVFVDPAPALMFAASDCLPVLYGGWVSFVVAQFEGRQG
jgi:hypothetical protein